MNNNYSFQCLFPVKQLTYPTPPYMTIRRAGIEDFRLPVRRRKLMDMIKKFYPNDISYIDDSSYTERSSQVYNTSIRDPSNKCFSINGDTVWAQRPQSRKLALKDISFINNSRFIERISQLDNTSIRDPANKYFVINGDNVWAQPLQGDNVLLKAKFKITVHSRLNIIRPPITLQVKDQDLYLSYQPNADKQLKVLPLGQRSLDFTKPETRPFFFYLVPVSNRKYSFESVMERDGIICTSPDSKSRVTVEPASDKTHNAVFAFDAAFYIGIVSGSGLLRPNIEILFGDDTLLYYFNDKLFQDRYEAMLDGEDYIMNVTSLALDRLYK
ncbi:uncharacterized protein LOC142748261 [Rhinoderma darwinii]|uniref:uncharacterized protein LOC142748261 n=1 Tax=Rhinoderma darwinii TaxID=43563 RepID=UPI003F66E32D